MAKFIKVFDAPNGSSLLTKNAVVVPTDGATMMDTTTTQSVSGVKTFTTPVLTTPTITGGTSSNTAITDATFGGKHQNLTALGSSIADAAAINAATTTILVTGGNNAVGVILPVAAAGKTIFLKNADVSNGILKVYPQVNSTINAIAANSSLDMAAKTSATFFGTSATNWVTIPLLPS